MVLRTNDWYVWFKSTLSNEHNFIDGGDDDYSV